MNSMKYSKLLDRDSCNNAIAIVHAAATMMLLTLQSRHGCRRVPIDPLAGDAQKGVTLVNGGFETGDLTGWTVSIPLGKWADSPSTLLSAGYSAC